MIRKYVEKDIDSVLDIWLEASIQAHNFVAADFWQSQLDSMRNVYLPMSESYVYEIDSKIVGFYSLYENFLAAIFVSPDYQGKGIGKQLINDAKKHRSSLTLNVFKENDASRRFYVSQGFEVVTEQADIHTGQAEYTMRLVK
ncbi:N-acetyltransferase [Vibrio astriarenae]|uniref:N-acetyltransferase n=1 Tax=Vibrio astriarenae TaxID=1481923 RepID=UPI0037353240